MLTHELLCKFASEQTNIATQANLCCLPLGKNLTLSGILHALSLYLRIKTCLCNDLLGLSTCIFTDLVSLSLSITKHLIFLTRSKREIFASFLSVVEAFLNGVAPLVDHGVDPRQRVQTDDQEDNQKDQR